MWLHPLLGREGVIAFASAAADDEDRDNRGLAVAVLGGEGLWP